MQISVCRNGIQPQDAPEIKSRSSFLARPLLQDMWASLSFETGLRSATFWPEWNRMRSKRSSCYPLDGGYERSRVIAGFSGTTI